MTEKDGHLFFAEPIFGTLETQMMHRPYSDERGCGLMTMSRGIERDKHGNVRHISPWEDLGTVIYYELWDDKQPDNCTNLVPWILAAGLLITIALIFRIA